MMARGKTLAMHVLDGRKVPYQVIEFPDSIHDALGVAAHAGLPPETVYKTLVVQALDPASQAPLRSHKPLLILVAATRTLDPKKVAAALGLKRVGMARQSTSRVISFIGSPANSDTNRHISLSSVKRHFFSSSFLLIRLSSSLMS